MNRFLETVARGSLVCVLIAIPGTFACTPLSEQLNDPTAGMNGGFESIRSGLPVNWCTYSPSTVPTGKFTIAADTSDCKEGAQSLRFNVEECSAIGGWHSPGLYKEVSAKPGATCTISLWIKSEKCAWTISFGGVAAKASESETIASPEFAADSWHRIERTYKVPPQYEQIRFQLSITSPGTLWLDDVKVEPSP